MTDREELNRRRNLTHEEAMLDAQALCMPCKLCGNQAKITDAGSGWGYFIRCEGAQKSRPWQGCIIGEQRLSGWAYNVMEWWNRLHAPAALQEKEAGE